MKISLGISAVLLAVGISVSAEPLNYKCVAKEHGLNLAIIKMQIDQNKILLFPDRRYAPLMGSRITTHQASDLSHHILYSVKLIGENPYDAALELYLEPDFLNEQAVSADRLFRLVQKLSFKEDRHDYICVRK